jgi:hypothetical protein
MEIAHDLIVIHFINVKGDNRSHPCRIIFGGVAHDSTTFCIVNKWKSVIIIV